MARKTNPAKRRLETLKRSRHALERQLTALMGPVWRVAGRLADAKCAAEDAPDYPKKEAGGGA